MSRIVSATGTSGFIGLRLVARLLNDGDQLKVLSRNPGQQKTFPPAVRFYCGDLNDRATLQELISGSDVLFHCAGELADEGKMLQTNGDGTRNLIEVARRQLPPWVQLSSTRVYGNIDLGEVTEESTLPPLGAYEQFKAESDRLVEEPGREGCFKYVLIRPAVVYGSRMPNQSLVSLIRAISNGLFFYIGQDSAFLNLIHVEDLFRALIVCSSDSRAFSQVFTLSNTYSLKTSVTSVCRMSKREPPRLRVPKIVAMCADTLFGRLPGFPLTYGRIRALTSRVLISQDKILKMLDFRTEVELACGLKELMTGDVLPIGEKAWS